MNRRQFFKRAAIVAAGAAAAPLVRRDPEDVPSGVETVTVEGTTYLLPARSTEAIYFYGSSWPSENSAVNLFDGDYSDA